MDVNVNTIAVAGDKTFSSTSTYTGGSRSVVNEPVPGTAVDMDIDVGISNTSGRLKFLGITAEGAAMTVKLMDSTGTIIDASAEFTLTAGQTIFWPSYDGEAAPAYIDAGNIAAIQVTNDSDPSVQGTLSASFLYDPTA